MSEEPRVLVEISSSAPNPLDVIKLLRSMCSDCGAVTVYLGVVKPFSSCGSRVKGIEVSADPSAAEELRRACLEIARSCGCRALYVWHREGFAESGAELAVIGAAAMTRHQVLECVRRAVDTVKSLGAIRRREITLE
ncbi:MAG: hypothetical protein GXO32_01300 [Crenarchaeota archaeon]|nr:hypothetical protein [Thermoproteota archaeon]